MERSRPESPLAVVWRRKAVAALTLVIVLAVTGAVSVALPKVYSTSAQLFVAQTTNTQSFDQLQAAQVTARTFAKLATSTNIAQLVANQLGGLTKDQLASKVTVTPIDQTQLLTITAEDHVPARAKQIADTYAQLFIQSRQSAASSERAVVSLADPAPVPDTPTRPKPKLYLLIGALLGLAAGVALAFIVERLDTRLRGVEEVEEAFGQPVLARIPPRGRTAPSLAAFAEAFRILRTNLQFGSPEGPLRSLAVTSAHEGEGKSTTVAQLALLTAATGTGVLVVETALRRPALRAIFAPESPEPPRPGLSNYVVEGVPLDEVIHQTSVPTLEWVPSGPSVPSLSGLLESDRGRAAFENFAVASDQVIYDCAPLDQGADAATVAARVEGVVLVVDLGRSTRESVQSAIRQLHAVRANVVGIVVNRDPRAGVTEGGDGAGPRSGRTSVEPEVDQPGAERARPELPDNGTPANPARTRE